MTTNYVMGLAFNNDGTKVVLIKKTKPAALAGKWNGIGGKIEPAENEYVAMAREFEEETGVKTLPEEWEYFGTLNGPDYLVTLFRLFDDDVVAKAKTMEAEIVYTFPVSELPDTTLDNTRWLIGVALDPSKPQVNVFYDPAA